MEVTGGPLCNWLYVCHHVYFRICSSGQRIPLCCAIMPNMITSQLPFCRVSQTIHSFSSLGGTCWVTSMQLLTTTESCSGYSVPDHERLSCTHPRPMTDFHPDSLLFCLATTKAKRCLIICLTSQFNDNSSFVFKHLLPSVERVALDRFTLKWICGCWESKWQINRAQQRKDVCEYGLAEVLAEVWS